MVNPPDPLRRSVIRREVLGFAIAGLLLLGLLALSSVWLAARLAGQESVRDATEEARTLARVAVQPSLQPGLSDSDPDAIAALDDLVKEHILDENIVAARLWTADGKIVYSDQPALLGESYPLDSGQLEALRDNRAQAELSDLAKPENRFQRAYGQLVEVYLPVRDPEGRAYLFEIYHRQDSLDAVSRQLLGAMLPVTAGSLFVLAAILLTLAWRMARRLEADRRQREALLVHAVNSSEVERARIAADLHDGVVQDLAGVSFTLAALAGEARAAGDGRQAGYLTESAERTRGAVRGLRTLLVDIYPPNLRDAGLAPAIQDLAASLGNEVTTEVSVQEGLVLSDAEQQALYRACRECVHNIRKHAQADTVTIDVHQRHRVTSLTISDDGLGFDPADVSEGHIGLSLLADLAAQVGGTLQVDSRPGQGTTIEFRIPTT